MVLFCLPWAGRQLEAQVQQALGLVAVLASATSPYQPKFETKSLSFLINYPIIFSITCKDVRGVTASCFPLCTSTLLLFSGGSLLFVLLFVELLFPVVELLFELGFLLFEPGGRPGPRFTGGVGVFSSFFLGAASNLMLVNVFLLKSLLVIE